MKNIMTDVIQIRLFSHALLESFQPHSLTAVCNASSASLDAKSAPTGKERAMFGDQTIYAQLNQFPCCCGTAPLTGHCHHYTLAAFALATLGFEVLTFILLSCIIFFRKPLIRV